MNGRTLLVLDPGHGGTQPAGASSPNRGAGPHGLLEKDVALDLARRVRDRLLATHTVVLTREGDTNLSLADRAGAASKLGADLFLSLHLSSTDPAADRTDVVVARDASPPSRALAESVRRHVGAVTGGAGQLLSADLGQLARDRHDPRTAACLVEIASLAAADRAEKLVTSEYRDRLADAIAAAVRATAAPELATPQWVGARYGRAQAVVTPDVDYRVTGLLEAAALWADWFQRFGEWSKGVPDPLLTQFPHAAVCQLRLASSDGNTYTGTGFYIADEVLLSCGHNFYDSSGTTTSVEVQPAFSPRMSVLPSATFAVDGRAVVHPRWLASQDASFDLAVLRVPGLPATAGQFNLANMSLAPDAGIVVCGYGKLDGRPDLEQGQRMDGARISQVDFDQLYYPILTEKGHSGSPVFHGPMVVGVHTRRAGAHENSGVLLTPEKNDWIETMAGVKLAHGMTARGAATTYASRSLAVTADSTQSAQSAEVRAHVAHSVGLAETGLRYDLVHDDSNRINFGIGSWTGARIADLLHTYAAFATESGLTAQLHGHFGGQAAFDAITARFRADGTSTVLSAAERAALAGLGADTGLRGAQDRHLAEDIRTDLTAIGSEGDPWYPYIDGGMGAISEIAAHVLVHARHQAGGRGLKDILRAVITHFGGDGPLGQAMVAGTVTERNVLDQVAARVVDRVAAAYRDGVRRRYATLFGTYGSSQLSYYFDPAN